MRPLDKVIGYNPVKKELYRILDVLNNSEKYAELGVHIPKGVMLEGEPGIGKSLMALSFMEECNRKSYIIRKNKPDGTFVDCIRETFEEAMNNEPSIILLDDIDKFANEDYSHCDAEEYVTVQACIDGVKKKDVFVIATANDIRQLPESLRRSGRFDKIFHMSFPKGEDAKKIIEHYLENKKCDESVDAEEISRFSGGHSCADLESVINDAGLHAVYEGRELISQDDLKGACLRKFYRISDDDDETSKEVLIKRVVHEAGHVVLAELKEPGAVNFVSASTKRAGAIGGYVSKENNDKFSLNFESEETEILILLAGKAATEIVLGETDIGANSDLHKAFDRVRRLLDNYVAYDFNSWCHGNETSQKIYDHLDSVTGAEISRYYMQAKHLLIKNRAFLDVIIDNLMEKKLLSYKDIAKIRIEGGF